MADTYNVKITVQAQQQIQEIIQYIATELQSPDAGLHLLDTLEDEISSLSTFPRRIALTGEEPWSSYGIHKMPVENFLVYFWIDEDAAKVQVTAVIYNKREQLHLLSQMNLE